MSKHIKIILIFFVFLTFSLNSFALGEISLHWQPLNYVQPQELNNLVSGTEHSLSTIGIDGLFDLEDLPLVVRIKVR